MRSKHSGGSWKDEKTGRTYGTYGGGTDTKYTTYRDPGKEARKSAYGAVGGTGQRKEYLDRQEEKAGIKKKEK
jgi:hypothetical protein